MDGGNSLNDSIALDFVELQLHSINPLLDGCHLLLPLRFRSLQDIGLFSMNGWLAWSVCYVWMGEWVECQLEEVFFLDALDGVSLCFQLQVQFLLNVIDAMLVDDRVGCLEVSLHVLVVVYSNLVDLSVEGLLVV